MTFKPTTFAKRVVLCAEIALLILGLCVPVIGLLWLVPFHPIQFLWGVLFAVVLIGGSAVIAATLMYLSSNPPRFMNATLLEWRRERDEKWVRHHVLLCTCGHLWGRHLSGQTNMRSTELVMVIATTMSVPVGATRRSLWKSGPSI